MFIKISLLIVFFAVMLTIGFLCRKNSTDVNGFVLGGRAVGPWVSAFAFGTSYFSAVIFVGYAGQFGWKYGIASTWVGIGNALIGSLLAWVILGRRTRIMTHHLDSATMPQFFASRFGGKSLKIAASIITFIFLIPYTASLYNGLSRLFGMAFNIDYSVCVIVMAVLTGIYVIAGGYMATAINDFIQGIIMLVGISAVVVSVLNSQGGFLAALDGLGRITDESVSTTPGIFASFFGPDPLNLLGVVILTSLGTWGLPQMVQKFYAIKSEKAISKGTVVSTFFAFVVAGGCYFLGGFGRLFSDKVDIAAGGYDSIIPTMLASLPDLLIAVVVVLVLSASMSTLSSLVLTSSSTLTLDLLKGTIIKDLDEKRQLVIMRCLIVVFVAISVVIAIIQYKQNVTFIAQLMGVSWGALAGAFLAPFLYGLYYKGTTKIAVWCSFIFSTVVMLANMLVRPAFPTLLQSPINAGAFCMLAGLVIVPVVSLFTPKPDKELVENAFSCYNKEVMVHQSTSLSDEDDVA
ncbi:MAG: sodium:solute symporter family protein [Butyrivibrio sp.]|nr:sodium:solute symporter family protein [Butyrivibrio sp.]